MCREKLILLVLGVTAALGIVASGCAPASEAAGPLLASPAMAGLSPEETVETFYAWYLGYPGNPLADGAYRSSELLTEGLIRRVDATVASFDKAGFDPFLCAQDVPERITTGEASVGDGRALVPFQTSFDGHAFTATLERVDGVWLIADVDCGGSTTTQRIAVDGSMTPTEVVERFYCWYLGCIGDGYSGAVQHPLVAGTYRSSEVLSQSLIEKVDAVLQASLEHGGYDPFLCAQDSPECVNVGDAVIVSGEGATVPVQEVWNPGTEVETTLELQVTLRRVAAEWRITGVVCPCEEMTAHSPEGPVTTTPEGAVTSFYSWYLWYAREIGNPLVDGAYRGSEFLTESLVQRVDEAVDSFERGGFDPFLCAQDVPEWVAIDESVTSGNQATLVVGTSFDGHTFSVELRREGVRWAISDVACRGSETGAGEGAAWEILQDEGYGFQMGYPADWALEEIEIDCAAENVPIKRVVALSPRGWDGRTPLATLEVGEGSLEELSMWPVSAENRDDATTIDGCTVLTGEGAYGELFYVFAHPTNPELHVAVRDQTGEHADLGAVINGMLLSFGFTG